SHLEHAEADPSLSRAWIHAAEVRPPGARARARSHAALEAARRDVRVGVPRARLPAGGIDELPRADRLVAARVRWRHRRRRGAVADGGAGAAVRDRGCRAQLRGVRSREARLDETALQEDGGAD